MAALETLLSLMSLQTAWAFLLPSANSSLVTISVSASDRFALAAASGLPPGLEKYDRKFLKDPKLCHCQAFLLGGQTKRAVNVVECTRLLEAARDNGDNHGLLFHASVPIIASGQLLGIINVATHEWQFLTAADLQLLSAVGAQVAVALERAHLFDVTQAQRLRLERELKLAREVQDSLLPDALPGIQATRMQSGSRRCGIARRVTTLPCLCPPCGRRLPVAGPSSPVSERAL